MAKTNTPAARKPGNETVTPKNVLPPVQTFDLGTIKIHKARVKTGIEWNWGEIKKGQGRVVPAHLAPSAIAGAHGYASAQRKAGKAFRFQTQVNKATKETSIIRIE